MCVTEDCRFRLEIWEVGGEDNVDENEEDDDESGEDGDSTSAIEGDASCLNRLNDYVKEKHARLREWKR